MFVTAGAASLAFDVTEPGGSGIDVLLIHAAVTDRRSWRPLIDRLRSPRRVVAYDARGFGETRYEPEPFSARDDAIAVLDAAGVGRAVIVAASAGGRVAVDLALSAPERVAGLVLIGSVPSGAPWPDEIAEPGASLDRAIDSAEAAGDLELANRLEAHAWLDGPIAPEGRVGGSVRAPFLEMNGVALRAPDAGEVLDTEPGWPRVASIDVPTLVLVGEYEFPELSELAKQLADRIPNADFRILAGVAHLPHLEGDEATLDAITGFVADC